MIFVIGLAWNGLSIASDAGVNGFHDAAKPRAPVAGKLP